MPTLMRVKSGLSTTQVVEGKRHATQGRSFVPQPTAVTMWTLATDGWMQGGCVVFFYVQMRVASRRTMFRRNFDIWVLWFTFTSLAFGHQEISQT